MQQFTKDDTTVELLLQLVKTTGVELRSKLSLLLHVCPKDNFIYTLNSYAAHSIVY